MTMSTALVGVPASWMQASSGERHKRLGSRGVGCIC